MRNDLTAKKFGRLTVIKKAGTAKDRHIMWECRCDCGEIAIVISKSLKNGDTQSCGCLLKELIAKGGGAYKHGKTPTKDKPNRIYGIWAGMLNRCNNPNNKNYAHYGGRGISVCDEWCDYEIFHNWALANGYSDDLTIDRINVNDGYSPHNCRWATSKEQNSNKRSCRFLTHKGETHTISEWANIAGIAKWTLLYRLKAGWDIAKALEQPVNNRKVK